MLSDNIIQKFVDEVEEKKIKVPDVRTIPVPEDLYINFDEGINKVLVNFEDNALYQGASKESLALTLMCLYKDDLYMIDFDTNPHEVYLKMKMKKLGYEINKYEGIIGIHQQHKRRASIHMLNQHHVLHT